MSAPVTPAQQIELLTHGLDLPLSPLDERVLRAIADGLAKAWSDLQDAYGPALLLSAEPKISSMMCTRLNQMSAEDRRWKQIVSSVSLAQESHTFDGTSLEQRPDLSLRLKVAPNPNFSVVVECKLIDPVSQKSVGLYCGEGLAKFLDGRYAWAWREGFMLGYVRDTSTLDGNLKPYLDKYQKRTPDPYATTDLPVSVKRGSHQLRRSTHERSFVYPKRYPNLPGPIALWHLWLYGKP
jgi:hypothetical protein